MSEARTEEATPKKLRDARGRGEVWRSPLVASAAVLLVAALVLGAIGEALLDALLATFRLALDAAAARSAPAPGALLLASASIAWSALAPLLVALVAAAALASFVQVGPLFATRAVGWRAERLDPGRGLAALFAPRRAIDLGVALLVVVVVLAAATITLRDAAPGALSLGGRAPVEALRASATVLRTILARSGLALAAIAVLDVAHQRWQFLRAQRMTRRELEREQREAEGDPQIARERARVRDELAHEAMLDEVASAATIVRGESDLAVALRLDPQRGLPEVLLVARGVHGARVLARAASAGVPVEHDVRLAADLAALPRTAAIPRSLYEPVARLFARSGR